MVAPNDTPTIAGVAPALLTAATGFRYKEIVTTTTKRDGEVVEETTVVHDRYAAPDPQAAKVLFEIGFQVLGGRK